MSIAVMVAGCITIGTPEEEKSPVNFTLRFENINSRDVDGTTYYDILISVDRINPISYESLWMNIKVWMEDGDGHSPTSDEYIPEKYDYAPRNEPTIFYEEVTGFPDQINEMDAFTLTGLDESYEDGQFFVYYGGHDAGSIRLPEDFS
jgi:hypothetical protein